MANKGLILLFTGNGKGKTTAALGVLTRAWGRDMKVAMFQFLKSKTGNWGEIRAAEKMGVEMTPRDHRGQAVVPARAPGENIAHVVDDHRASRFPTPAYE